MMEEDTDDVLGGVGGILIGGLIGTILIARISYSAGVDDGKKEQKEKSLADKNALQKKLETCQREKEAAKENFCRIISDVGRLEASDPQFFSKTQRFLQEYTKFHVFVIACMSYCRLCITDTKTDMLKGCENELTQFEKDTNDVLLGLVRAGYPEPLKENIDILRNCQDKDQLRTIYEDYKGKLNPKLKEKLFEVNTQIEKWVRSGLDEILFNRKIK